MIAQQITQTPLNNQATITLPDWTSRIAPKIGTVLKTEEAKINLAIYLSAMNVREGTGGPFGAAIFDLETHELLGIGVNRVVPTSMPTAHAEMVAYALTSHQFGKFNLAEIGSGNIGIYSSCEPCAMCMGATQWSGVKKLVFGAPASAAEKIGFDEGIKPEGGIYALQKAGVEVIQLREAYANSVLRSYGERGGIIYNGNVRTDT